MEFEAMCAKREAERKSAKDRETAGLKWWQGSLPSNMMAIERRPELLQLLVEGATTSRLQILNFFNEDCYACRTLYPQIKKLANQHPDVIFVEVNGTPEEMRPLLEEMGITRVPYFHFYKNGRVVSQFTASLNPEKLAMLRLEITSHRQ